jgi:hypothetical protein
MTCVLREERLECVLQPSIEGILILSQLHSQLWCLLIQIVLGDAMHISQGLIYQKTMKNIATY